MRLLLALAASVLTLSAPIASAQILPGGSVHLAWDDCFAGGAGGASSKSFACDTDQGGAFHLFASVVPPEGITEYIGSYAVIDFQFDSGTVPDWWRLGTCRSLSSITAAPAALETSCPDLTSDPQYGGIEFAPSPSRTNHMRLRTVFATRLEDAGPLPTTTEHTLLRIAIDRRNTGGASGCADCPISACIVFQLALLDQIDQQLPKGIITTGDQQFVFWQNSSVGCVALPTRPRTWGQIKSLYR